MANRSTYDYLFKILLIGDSSVGKQDVLLRFAEGASNAMFIPTINESDGLQTLLGFVKGLDTIHSLGFDLSPRLKFHHLNPVDEHDGYANILTVPVFMSDNDLF